ncbi:MAG: hypothetical protein PHI05_05280 [Bacilli bacterium]|nr:hypothetical protein [Bacilli bacterium]
MKKWEDFESEMKDYLQEMLKKYDVLVKQFGNADSTIPDIEITINSNNKKFYVETKMPSSQTSQFVVEIKDNKFIYGKKNKFEANQYSDEIIKILNDNYQLYKNVAQSGMNIPVPETIVFGWIASNMKNKNVEFIISVDESGDKMVFSLEQFNEIFNIKTTLRRKKSGSQNLPKIYYEDFEKHLNLKFKGHKYELYSEKDKLYINLPLELSKSECYIDSDVLPKGKRYFLSNKGNNKYVVKITSATNNPNIIFELSLKDNIDFDMFTIQCLIEYITNNK